MLTLSIKALLELILAENSRLLINNNDLDIVGAGIDGYRCIYTSHLFILAISFILSWFT